MTDRRRSSRMRQLKSMTQKEVKRIHRIHFLFGDDTDGAIEMLADLRAYCGSAWPKMLQEALERYQKDRRCDE